MQTAARESEEGMKHTKTSGRFCMVIAALTLLLLRTGGAACATPPALCKAWTLHVTGHLQLPPKSAVCPQLRQHRAGILVYASLQHPLQHVAASLRNTRSMLYLMSIEDDSAR